MYLFVAHETFPGTEFHRFGTKQARCLVVVDSCWWRFPNYFVSKKNCPVLACCAVRLTVFFFFFPSCPSILQLFSLVVHILILLSDILIFLATWVQTANRLASHQPTQKQRKLEKQKKKRQKLYKPRRPANSQLLKPLVSPPLLFLVPQASWAAHDPALAAT